MRRLSPWLLPGLAVAVVAVLASVGTTLLLPRPSLAPRGTYGVAPGVRQAVDWQNPGGAPINLDNSVLGTVSTINGSLTVNGALTVAAPGNVTPKPWVDVTASTYGADPTGASDSGAAIQLAINAAGANGRVYFPAGTYLVGTGVVGGNGLFTMNSSFNGIELFGDGPGKTVIQWNNATITGSNATVFWLSGAQQSVHDMSIFDTAGQSGAGTWYGITCGVGCTYARLSNLEFKNVYGGNTAGGSAIAMSQNYNTMLATTTTSTTVTANTSTAITPVAMTGIYPGAWIQLVNGGTSEYLTVASTTASTFTCTPINAYSGTTTVNVPSLGFQGNVVKDVWIHDSFSATGVDTGTSCGNTFRSVRVTNVGKSNAQHGFYVHGGKNTFTDCYVEGAYGASWQFQNANTQIDMSGNKMVGCSSVNPASYHIVWNAQANFGGTSPEMNPGDLVGRYLTITGSVFKNTRGMPTNQTPFLIQAPGFLLDTCTLEDIDSANSFWIDLNPNANAYVSNCAVRNCLFRTTNPQPQSPTGFIHMGCTDSEVAGCRMYMTGFNSTCIKTDGPNNGIHDNWIYLTGTANGISLTNLANNCTIVRNHFQVLGGNSCAGIRQGTAPQAQNVLIDSNVFTSTATGTNYWCRFEAAGPSNPTGQISNNYADSNLLSYFRTASQDLIYRNNAGKCGFQGNATESLLDQACGNLVPYPTAANTITAGLSMKLDANQNLTALATTDTVWWGFPVSSGGSGGVAQVKITAAGTGFTSAPTVAFGTGSAVATADLKVVSTTVTAAGSGYTKAPTVVFSTNGASSAAQGFATLKLVGTPTVVSQGAGGYTNNDVVTVSGGTFGTVATMTLTVSGGNITSVAVNAAGSYSVPPQGVVSVTGGTGSGATFTLSWGVNTIPVTYGGAGYTGVATISILGDGSSATATATMGVGTIKVTTESSGYTSPPSVTVSSGGGSGCTAVAFLHQTYLAGVGSIVPVTTDGTWTAGHYGIASTTAGGQVHDNSTSAPAAPASYGTFLDSGTGSGTARFLILKCN